MHGAMVPFAAPPIGQKYNFTHDTALPYHIDSICIQVLAQDST